MSLLDPANLIFQNLTTPISVRSLFMSFSPTLCILRVRCDLIVMATHGRGGLQRWVMGSVTERVLGATKLPLLIIRPKNEQHRYPRSACSNMYSDQQDAPTYANAGGSVLLSDVCGD